MSDIRTKGGEGKKAKAKGVGKALEHHAGGGNVTSAIFACPLESFRGLGRPCGTSVGTPKTF